MFSNKLTFALNKINVVKYMYHFTFYLYKWINLMKNARLTYQGSDRFVWVRGCVLCGNQHTDII